MESVCPYCNFRSADFRLKLYVLPPFTILHGKYLVGDILGAGGFGITYIALDMTLDRKVAVKEFFMRDEMYRDNSTSTTVTVTNSDYYNERMFEINRAKFEEEARTLARLDSLPGIVGVFEYFEENETSYMVLEFLEGMTLKQYTQSKGGRLAFEEVLEKLAPIMNSLDILHEQGILHRDISPDNIMVLRDGGMKLFDFGGAKQLTASDDQKSVVVMKKAGYTPVEQYSNVEQGPWTDEYALAATFYYCVTGVVPVESILRTLADDPLKKPSELGVQISQTVESVLMKALSVHAVARYRSIYEFSNAFYAALNAGHHRGGRHKTVGVTAAVIIAGVIIGIAAGILQRARIENGDRDSDISSSPDVIVSSGVSSMGTTISEQSDTGRTEELISSPESLNTSEEKAEAIEGLVQSIVESGDTSSEDIEMNIAPTEMESVGSEESEGELDSDASSESEPSGESAADEFSEASENTIESEKDHSEQLSESPSVDGVPGTETIDELEIVSGSIATAPEITVPESGPVRTASDYADVPGYISWADSGIEDHAVEWNDSVLEARFRNLTEIDERDIMLSDVWELKEISLTPGDGGEKIRNIDAIKEFHNLEELNLNYNNISDITPLAELPNLKWLTLNTNDIYDISPLAEMSRLKTIDLSNNHIEDFSPLRDAVSLERITVFNSGLTNESFNELMDILVNLRTVVKLDIGGNPITDFHRLSELRDLVYFNMWSAGIDDTSLRNLVDALKELPSLESVHLRGNSISDVSSLALLVHLNDLDLQSNQITDVTPLGTLEYLDTLKLADNPISDYSAVKGIRNLTI